jgi:hypothetical protein
VSERRATELSRRSPFFLRINLPRTAVEDRSDPDGDGNTTESARAASADEVELLIALLEYLLP